MFEFLSNIDNSIISRYFTVERNIKSRSNSFYDSYLDLLESTYKRILVNEKIPYDPKYTCGQLLRQADILKFLRNTIKIDSVTYDKSLDYIKKANEHKHKGEKNINAVTVVSYMKVYYDVARTYLVYKGKTDVPPFDGKYFDTIFGITVKQNKQLLSEVDLLKSDVEVMFREKRITEQNFEEYKALLSIEKINNLPLDEQNIELKRKIDELKRAQEKVTSKLDEQSNKLDEIKEILKGPKTKSVSDQIGMDFASIFNRATIYFYEDDVVRFNSFKKHQILKLSLFLLIALGFLVYGIIDFTHNKNYFVLLVSLVNVLTVTLSLYYIFIQKNKKKAHSFFNAINLDYRLTEKMLVCDSKIGFFGYIFITLKIILIAVSFSLALYMVFVTDSSSSSYYIIRMCCLYGIVIFNIFTIFLPKYQYPNDVFDAGDIKVLRGAHDNFSIM